MPRENPVKMGVDSSRYAAAVRMRSCGAHSRLRTAHPPAATARSRAHAGGGIRRRRTRRAGRSAREAGAANQCVKPTTRGRACS